jgi:hypothetical protein
MSRTSRQPIFAREVIDAITVSRTSFMPFKGFNVLISFKSFMDTRDIRATTITVRLILFDTADAIEITTTMKSAALLGSQKYLLHEKLDSSGVRIGTSLPNRPQTNNLEKRFSSVQSRKYNRCNVYEMSHAITLSFAIEREQQQV